MTEQELMSALEAIIYAADEPATIDQMLAAIGGEKVELRAAPASAPSFASCAKGGRSIRFNPGPEKGIDHD